MAFTMRELRYDIQSADWCRHFLRPVKLWASVVGRTGWCRYFLGPL